MPSVQRSILVVEDDRDLRLTFAQCLESAGYSVSSASNGLEALEHIRGATQNVPDLILLDATMPIMSGWKFLEERTRDPLLAAVPVVMLSGYQDAAENTAASTGVERLAKPVSVKALLDTVRRYCGTPT